MKICLQGQGAGWVIDNIVNDFKKHSKHDIVDIKDNPDVLWCVNLFSFPSIYRSTSKKCKNIVQIHHINEAQIDAYDFSSFNKADACIVPNKITETVASNYMTIPIYRFPYWLLSTYMEVRNETEITFLKKRLRNSVNHDELLIGSFVKDGNGKLGKTPKSVKGPVELVDVLIALSKKIAIRVVLGGYGRNWIKEQLDKHGIPYVYLQKYKNINTLYDCLDYYFVTSKIEGGPQSILEASYRKVKILSTKVGLAPEILHPKCICNSTNDFVNRIINKEYTDDYVQYNYNSVNHYLPTEIISQFDMFFANIVDGKILS